MLRCPWAWLITLIFVSSCITPTSLNHFPWGLLTGIKNPKQRTAHCFLGTIYLKQNTSSTSFCWVPKMEQILIINEKHLCASYLFFNGIFGIKVLSVFFCLFVYSIRSSHGLQQRRRGFFSLPSSCCDLISVRLEYNERGRHKTLFKGLQWGRPEWWHCLKAAWSLFIYFSVD